MFSQLKAIGTKIIVKNTLNRVVDYGAEEFCIFECPNETDL